MKYLIKGRYDYHKLINIILINSDYFSVCSNKKFRKSLLKDSYFNFFDTANPYKVDNDYRFDLPRYYGGQKIHIFKLNDITKALILQTNSFNDWNLPDLPEDISFYQNKKLWLNTISHESMVIVSLENSTLMNDILLSKAELIPFMT